MMALGVAHAVPMVIAPPPAETIRLMMWNIESFTNGQRPSWRGLLPERIGVLGDTLTAHAIDIAILLETGADGGTIAVPGYTAQVTAVTGKDDPPAYNGETYTILTRTGLTATVAAPALVGAVAADFRQAVMFRVTSTDGAHHVDVCALHAPSPGHPTADRQNVINACCTAAVAAAAGTPLVFCGDLNFKGDELAYLAAALTPLGMVHEGPGCATSIRTDPNALSVGAACQPYDQVWMDALLAGGANGEIFVLPTLPVMQAYAWSWVAQRYMERFMAQALEGGVATRQKGRPPELVDAARSRLGALELVHADLTSAGDTATRLGVASYAAFLAHYAAKVVTARGIEATMGSDAELRRMIKYLDELFMQAQMLLLLLHHGRHNTPNGQEVVTRALMSDHIPVRFDYTFP